MGATAKDDERCHCDSNWATLSLRVSSHSEDTGHGGGPDSQNPYRQVLNTAPTRLVIGLARRPDNSVIVCNRPAFSESEKQTRRVAAIVLVFTVAHLMYSLLYLLRSKYRRAAPFPMG